MAGKRAVKIYQLSKQGNLETLKDEINFLISKVDAAVKEKGIKVVQMNKDPYCKNCRTAENADDDRLQVYAYKLENNQKTIYTNFFPKEVCASNTFSTKQDMFICFVIAPRKKNNPILLDQYNLYFFSSWYSFMYLFPFVNQEFPMLVAKKLITGAIKNEKTVSITGDTLASDLIFRNMKALSKYDNIGKVVTGFIGKVDRDRSKTNLQALGLIIAKKEQIFCDVGNAFELKKTLEFDKIINLIADLNTLYERWEEDSDYEDFQMLKKISSKIDSELIESLEEEVIQKIFEDYQNWGNAFLSTIDIVDPKNFMDFIATTDFKLTYRSIQKRDICWTLSIEKIMNLIKEDNSKLKKEELRNVLKSQIFIEWFCNKEVTNFSSLWEDLLKLMVVEFDYKNKKYFLINGLFYEVKDDFIEVLNQELFLELQKWDIFLSQELEGKFKKRKKGENEWVYNRRYLNEPNTLVLDKVLYNKNIEFCDLLYNENGQTYLIHNKRWFDRDMRVLSEQILLSAAIISEERKVGDYWKIKEYYVQLKNKEKTSKMEAIWNQKINEVDFVEMFNSKSMINYILGFTYESDIIELFKRAKEWNVKDEIYECLNNLSIIPRYELLSLIKKMRILWIKLFITQIPLDK